MRSPAWCPSRTWRAATWAQLQLAIWKKQFEASRDGDRFFYLNDPALPMIQQLFGINFRRSLAQIIRANTGAVVQDDVFKAPVG